MVVGGVGLGLGGVFGMEAARKKSDAGCAANNVCPNPTSAGVLEDAKSAGTRSTIAFVAGGVLVAGGVAILVWPSMQPTNAAGWRLRAAPVVGRDGAAAIVAGEF